MKSWLVVGGIDFTSTTEFEKMAINMEVIALSRKPQEITVNLTVKFVPNPNPQRGIDLLAELVLKQILIEEHRCKGELTVE